MTSESEQKVLENGEESAPVQPARVAPGKPSFLGQLAGNPVVRRAAPVVAVSFLVLAIAAAGVYFAKRQLNGPTGADGPPSEESPAADAAAGGDAIGTPLVGGEPATGKILNSAADGLKAGAAHIKENAGALGQSTLEGSISKLPPPPASAEGGANDALQDAAKDAAKLFAPRPADPPADIDLSTPEPEAALDRLERAASHHSSNSIVSSMSVSGAREILNSIESVSAPAGGDNNPPADQQALEITRLRSELEQLRNAEAPAARQAMAALYFNAMADKARSGEPFRRELDAFAKASDIAPAPALEAAANGGVATPASLKAEFPAVRDGALAEARRARAKGPLSSLAANAAALVRLRPAAPIDGVSPEAVFSRAEARLGADDLAGALLELEGLTGPARHFASSWVDAATTRVEVDAAINVINKALIAAADDGRAG